MNLVEKFLSSTTYVKAGFQTAATPTLRPYVIIPILINVVLFASMTFLIIGQLSDWLSDPNFSITLPSFLSFFQSGMDALIEAAKWLILLFAVVMLLVISASVFTAATQLLAAPFNGYLSEKTEAKQRTLSYPSNTLSQLVVRTISREVSKIIYWLTRALGVLFVTLILSLIPVVNLITPVIWFLFSAWIMGIEYLDIPADNNGITYPDTRTACRQQRLTVLGFGTCIMGLTLIPIVNLVIIPVAVCGATLLWIEKIEPELIPKSTIE